MNLDQSRDRGAREYKCSCQIIIFDRPVSIGGLSLNIVVSILAKKPYQIEQKLILIWSFSRLATFRSGQNLWCHQIG
jgi:hypothetical protein